LLLLGFLVWLGLRWRSHNDTIRVDGLTAQLWQGGFSQEGLPPRDPRAKAFHFVLVEEFTGPQLQQAGPGEMNVYEVRRIPGGVSFTAPGQQPVKLAMGERKDIGKGLSVAFTDEKATTSSVISGPPDPIFAGPAPSSYAGATEQLPTPPAFPGSYDPFDPGPPGGSPPPRRGDAPADPYFDPNNPF
jgi:hypothetical protein